MKLIFDGQMRKNDSYQLTSRSERAEPDRTKVAKPIIRINKTVQKSEGFVPLPEVDMLNKIKSARVHSRNSLEDLLPEKTEKQKVPSKIFQGTEMREDASLLSKLFFAYAEPLVKIA